MNECLRIVDQLHRVFFGGAWHGPAVKEALGGVNAEMAKARILPGSHSIWELVHHIRAWIAEADATVRGKEYESLKGDKDWPPIPDSSPAAWDRTMAALEQAELSLEDAIGSLPPDKLGEGDRSFYYLLHGICEHNTYHAGQIVLLKNFTTRVG
jgi:hypothetical protein